MVEDWVNPWDDPEVDGGPVRIEGLGPPPPGPASRAHRKRRQERQAKVVAEGHAPRPAAYARHAVELSTLPTMLESQELPVEWGAYRAGMPDARELRGSKKARSVDDFLRLGFQVVQWNGMYITYTSN
ncbi:hypothetical protein HMN09_01006200 [Mycena chlorophos]|uniref:Uncharacterized protein n=1 Tax=Mycena chlorophos TaxID=658473 RepID=A0A8H6SFL6_MYCCL|nr:hypothetical protein HMN09_01006200 [Mycena chlorophos]